MNQRPSLEHYLQLEYPYTVAPDDGSYFIKYPDLPGCMTQVEDATEIATAAEEIRILWLETTYDQGMPIPEPAGDVSYSGKFQVRLPKSLHRDLAEQAGREGMSLNAYVNYLLAERNAVVRIGTMVEALQAQYDALVTSPTEQREEPGESLEEMQQRRGLRLVYTEAVAV